VTAEGTSASGDERATVAAVEPSPAIDELVRAVTRILLGSAGLAVSSAMRWQAEPEEGGDVRGPDAADTLASAALGMGLTVQRLVARGASAAGSTAASVTWGVVHATPLRGPVERLAARFRTERRLSEQEVADAANAILEAVSGALLDRVDLDRVIDRIALERVLARVDVAELERRIVHEGAAPPSRAEVDPPARHA